MKLFCFILVIYVSFLMILSCVAYNSFFSEKEERKIWCFQNLWYICLIMMKQQNIWWWNSLKD